MWYPRENFACFVVTIFILDYYIIMKRTLSVPINLPQDRFLPLKDSQFLNLLIPFEDNETFLSVEDCVEFEKSVISEEHVILDFNLTTEFVEDKKDIFEVKFFVQRNKDLKIFVNQEVANTFRLNDPVELHLSNSKVVIEFSLIEGEGSFWGHLFYSTRPSNSVKDPFQSFDWMVGLRTVKRASGCRIRAKISFF